MRKLMVLMVVGFVVFVVVYRQRLFLRDPLASVTRDGMKQNGVAVMINYSNDVLVDDSSGGKHRIYLVQGWNKLAGYPAAPLKCVQGLFCMTDADEASETKVEAGLRGQRSPFEGVTMTNRRVEFVDEDGALVQVVLR